VSSLVDGQTPAGGRGVTLFAPRLWSALRLLPTSRPHRWGDPTLVGVVSLVIYGLHGYDGVLDRDLGIFAYGGIQVTHGTAPYVGVFNSVGPLADAVPGLAMWLGHVVGADPLYSARLFFTVLSALACALLCVLARDVTGSRAAGFVAPAVFLTFQEFLNLASDGPREKTTMVVLLLGCLILLGRRRWASAGVCTALATLAWQPVLAVAVAALVAAVLLDQRDTTRRILLRFTVGGLVPSALTVCFYLGAGALSRALDGFVVINVGYTEQPGLLTRPRQIVAVEWSAYHASLPLAVVGLVALLVLGVRAVPVARRPTVSARARRLVVCAAGALAGIVWTVLVVNGGPDLFLLLPFAALGVAAAVVLLAGLLPRRAALATVVAIVAVAVAVAGVESVSTRNDELVLQRADVDAVLATQPPDATVVSLSAPQVLALSGRQSPTPYQVMSLSQERYLDATYPGGMRGFLGTLEELHPTFVAVGRRVHAEFARDWLATDYWRVGGNDSWKWYLARSAGRDALVRARFAHDEVMAAYGG
jgi:hypothetical protein